MAVTTIFDLDLHVDVDVVAAAGMALALSQWPRAPAMAQLRCAMIVLAGLTRADGSGSEGKLGGAPRRYVNTPARAPADA